VSRKALRRRVEALERRVDPPSNPAPALVIPNQVQEAGRDAVDDWFREEVKKYPAHRKFVLMPEWDDAVAEETQRDHGGVRQD